MQKIAAYLLERRGDAGAPEARLGEARRVQGAVEEWLRSKGVERVAQQGAYRPDDGSTGTYVVEDARDGDRSWWMVRLDETTAEGRRFRASVSVTAGRARVSVYITLEAGWITTQVAPVHVDPRCPRLVRSLLAQPGVWYHGASRVHQRWEAVDFTSGQIVVTEIEDQDRTLPLVVVSVRDGEVVLPQLDEKLAFDLAGLANVVRLGRDASWALTDAFGRHWSCYAGAVRIYWPRFSTTQDRFGHPLWTAEGLLASGGSPAGIRETFRRQLRSLVFRTSALSVTRPQEIDQIRDAATQSSLAALSAKVASSDDDKALAAMYAGENDRLRVERDELHARVDELQRQLVRASADRAALVAHLQAAGSDTSFAAPDEIAPDTERSDQEDQPPKAGEIRYYKKKYSARSHDIMVRVDDCGHNNWEGAHSADKAKKGISKLEGGLTNWERLQHCASCTGGGMWRVKW